MATPKQKPQYAPPATQVDLEERLKNGNESNRVLSTADNYKQAVEEDDAAREFTVEGNKTDDYVNTDPIYQTYANDTEAPAQSEKGPEADLEAIIRGEKVSTPDGVITVEEAQELSDAKEPLPVDQGPVMLVKMVSDDDGSDDSEDDEDDEDAQAPGTGPGDLTGPTAPGADDNK